MRITPMVVRVEVCGEYYIRLNPTSWHERNKEGEIVETDIERVKLLEKQYQSILRNNTNIFQCEFP